MVPLKEDDTYLVLNERGFAEEEAEGFYRHDTRFLSRYRLEGAVRSLTSDFQLARMKAIAHNCSYRIRIRPERSEYFLEREASSGSDPWPGTVEGGVRKFDDPANPYYFAGVELVKSSYDPLFLPRGSVIGTTVTLRNTYGQRKIILSSQGRIRIQED